MYVNVSSLCANANALIKSLQDDDPLATLIKREVDQLMNMIEIENNTFQFQVMDDFSKTLTKSTHEEDEVNLII